MVYREIESEKLREGVKGKEEDNIDLTLSVHTFFYVKGQGVRFLFFVVSFIHFWRLSFFQLLKI